MVRDFKNHSDSPDLEFQKVRGNPKHLTQVLETGDSISVVGQNRIESREPKRGNLNDPIPIFSDGLIPHMAASAGANAGTKVGGGRFDLEAFPIRDVFPKPIFGIKGKIIEIFKIGGDDNALGRVELKIGERCRFIKNGFDTF